MLNHIERAARALTDLNKWALVEEIIEGMYASIIHTTNATKVMNIAKKERIRLLRIYDRSRSLAAQQKEPTK